MDVTAANPNPRPGSTVISEHQKFTEMLFLFLFMKPPERPRIKVSVSFGKQIGTLETFEGYVLQRCIPDRHRNQPASASFFPMQPANSGPIAQPLTLHRSAQHTFLSHSINCSDREERGTMEEDRKKGSPKAL